MIEIEKGSSLRGAFSCFIPSFEGAFSGLIFESSYSLLEEA